MIYRKLWIFLQNFIQNKANMKNLLILVPSIGRGGQEKVAINTYYALKGKCNVFFAVFQRVEEEYEFRDKLYNLNLPAKSGKINKIFQQINRVRKLIKFCRDNKIQGILSFGETANITSVTVKKIIKIKSIVSIRGFAEVYKSKITDFVFSNSDKVLCISKDMEYNLLKLFPDLKNTLVIENGYNTDKILKGRANTSKFDCNSPKIISMGRLEEVKGFDRLIKAFSFVCKNIPNAHLSLQGNGSLQSELKDLAKKLNIEKNVSFLGFSSDPYEELLKNDIYVLSSRNEGFPNALVEGMICNLVPVAVDCLSGPREILSEEYSPKPVDGVVFEKYGVLVANTEDSVIVNNLAKVLLELIANKDKMDYYKSMTEERSVYYSFEKYTNKVINLIEEVI